jgi:hypothetical protein
MIATLTMRISMFHASAPAPSGYNVGPFTSSETDRHAIPMRTACRQPSAQAGKQMISR